MHGYGRSEFGSLARGFGTPGKPGLSGGGVRAKNALEDVVDVFYCKLNLRNAQA